MNATRLSPSRRREDIRAWWAAHLAAQCSSGKSLPEYCREQGLDAKYLSLWKRKLAQPAVAAPPRIVPVTLKCADAPAATTLRISLPNGLSVSLDLTLAALPSVIEELGVLRC